MNNTKDSNKYATKDQNLATVLYALKERLLTTEWERETCHFIFEDKKKCEEIVMRYFTNELRANPKIVLDALKTIKNILYSKPLLHK